MKRSHERIIAALSLTAVALLGEACTTAVNRTDVRMHHLASLAMGQFAQASEGSRYTGKPSFSAGVLIDLEGPDMAVLQVQSSTHRPDPANTPEPENVDALDFSIVADADRDHIGQAKSSVTFYEMKDGSWNGYLSVTDGGSPAYNSLTDPVAFDMIADQASTLVAVQTGELPPRLTAPS